MCKTATKSRFKLNKAKNLTKSSERYWNLEDQDMQILLPSTHTIYLIVYQISIYPFYVHEDR